MCSDKCVQSLPEQIGQPKVCARGGLCPDVPRKHALRCQTAIKGRAGPQTSASKSPVRGPVALSGLSAGRQGGVIAQAPARLSPSERQFAIIKDQCCSPYRKSAWPMDLHNDGAAAGGNSSTSRRLRSISQPVIQRLSCGSDPVSAEGQLSPRISPTSAFSRQPRHHIQELPDRKAHRKTRFATRNKGFARQGAGLVRGHVMLCHVQKRSKHAGLRRRATRQNASPELDLSGAMETRGPCGWPRRISAIQRAGPTAPLGQGETRRCPLIQPGLSQRQPISFTEHPGSSAQ